MRIAILGAGRMGQGLALALAGRGIEVALGSRSSHPVAPPLRLHPAGLAGAARDAELVLLAAPDDAIAEVAAGLARADAIRPDQVVLHVSGLLDRSALEALAPSGAGLGSFHPLQTVADPRTAAERLRGAYVAVEGDARAVAAGRELAGLLGLTAVRLDAAAKPLYHAAATVAANYLVVLLEVAERLAREAGVAPELAGKLFLPLVEGAVANVAELGAAGALTGPVRRGDARTVAAHLAALPAGDRELYRVLGLRALALAEAAGLDPGRVARVAAALRGGEVASDAR
ncbi:MAG TPA: DUF2520 domain-containing protein [Gemmatimonadales bacterium]|nr:DUF2520 domain-containing protein [Gemmatimonadales bacterium]